MGGQGWAGACWLAFTLAAGALPAPPPARARIPPTPAPPVPPPPSPPFL